MDYLRSCYASNMRLFNDRPDVLTPGQWYFCPPGAKRVPFMDSFVSQNWDIDPLTLDPRVGEVRGRGAWRRGDPPPRYTGQNTCGTAAQWLNGVPFAQRGLPPRDADGYPTCCVLAPPPVVDFCLLCENGQELFLEDGTGCIEYEH